MFRLMALTLDLGIVSSEASPNQAEGLIWSGLQASCMMMGLRPIVMLARRAFNQKISDQAHLIRPSA